MKERYLVIEMTVDDGDIEGIAITDVFQDRATALAAWEEEGRYERNIDIGVVHYTRHVMVVERNGKYFNLDGEPIRGIPGFDR